MQWEYQMVKVETHGFTGGKFDAPSLLRQMNELGRDRWELVSAFDTNKQQGQSRDIIMVFKRPLPRS